MLITDQFKDHTFNIIINIVSRCNQLIVLLMPLCIHLQKNLLYNPPFCTTYTVMIKLSHTLNKQFSTPTWGTVAAAPPPFRPGNPALCGSHPLVTPYYCRLGDLLCFVFICVFIVFFRLILYSVCSFSTLILLVGSSDL